MTWFLCLLCYVSFCLCLLTRKFNVFVILDCIYFRKQLSDMLPDLRSSINSLRKNMDSVLFHSKSPDSIRITVGDILHVVHSHAFFLLIKWQQSDMRLCHWNEYLGEDWGRDQFCFSCASKTFFWKRNTHSNPLYI